MTEETGNNIEMKLFEQQRGSFMQKMVVFSCRKVHFLFFPVFKFEIIMEGVSLNFEIFGC